MELYQIDRELRDLPQFYKMYSMYEMEECIENEERYGDVISRLEKMADRIETNKTIAYLEYDSAKDKVELEDAEKVSEERYKIRPEKEQQAKEELKDMETSVNDDVNNHELHDQDIFRINEKMKELERQILDVIEG